jgi:hypothetical protein
LNLCWQFSQKLLLRARWLVTKWATTTQTMSVTSKNTGSTIIGVWNSVLGIVKNIHQWILNAYNKSLTALDNFSVLENLSMSYICPIHHLQHVSQKHTCTYATRHSDVRGHVTYENTYAARHPIECHTESIEHRTCDRA